ncbi:hypothetical protein FNF27_01508 [Cafeteria roenbergensis]|uniref:Dol-P-Glc:Glc(2)Man(9)GlcNAc(2)-PP-Dol alpha-1,2-glucosyltransferase n=1 Tax=Cafeteria roenbergensis TaxID=33653 RepID=A0A5A8EJ00_CAFRO|nr:hypothetical protein FNF29_07893 [Cafeteria roenbergensis]KAA0177178.1 hypothetical protein FNF27_01508 [Cafeteria roenbergensis]|eukprot:KAA0146651.1 hypothetical protein FNF29_07893 [Cafeteria roenbergensis]
MALVPVAAALAAGLAYAAVAAAANRAVPEPFMDEAFHVPQTQAFCQGRFDVWDQKITTPPGAYLAAAAASAAADALGAGGALCSNSGLRYVSAALGGVAVGLASLTAARLFSYASGGRTPPPTQPCLRLWR